VTVTAIRGLAAAAATMLACWSPTIPVGAVELLTGDGYLYALTQDGQARAEALSYLGGTLDNLLVLNEVLGSEGTPLFCMSEQQAANLDSERLKADFGEWLKQPVETSSGERTAGTLPVALLGWGFLSERFACATAEAAASNAEIRALLLDSVRR
jgi:hypothetical protein